MTGIERLRGVAGFWRENKLDDIVEQIEREQGGRVSRMRVLSVVTEMERHVSGVEGMEDSPVARWARELREALGGNGRDPAADVSVSAYDLLSAGERKAIAWVREHGGLDHVKAEWRSRSNLKRMYEKEKAKVERQQRHIEFVQGKCRERQGHIVELNKMVEEMRPRLMPDGCDGEFLRLHMSNLWSFMFGVMDRLGVDKSDSYAPEIAFDAIDRRLMPEGCEWPRYESGEPVNLGDRYECWCGKTHVVSSVSVRKGCSVLNASDKEHKFIVSDGPLASHGKRVKRPSVPAGDGEPLEAGQTVWHVVTGREYTVRSCTNGGAHLSRDGKPAGYCRADYLTHQRPVLGADGVPIETCQKMWRVRNGEEVRVSQIDRGKHPIITYIGEDGLTHEITPDGLTHTKPEPPDSWERVEEDALLSANDYRERHGMEKRDGVTWPQQIREDLVRRCRALAERERGE